MSVTGDRKTRILILGNGGSGKTTAANNISASLGIPLLHLDSIYWENGWKHVNKKKFTMQSKTFMKQDAWVIEGTPMFDIESRVSRANIIIFLDVNRFICIYRVFKRWVSSFTLRKNDPSGCPTVKFKINTYVWIFKFHNKQRVQICDILKSRTGASSVVYIIKSHKEIKKIPQIYPYYNDL